MAPGENCGSDATPDGSGEVREPRLYQLIRQKGHIQDRIFEIEFLDPGFTVLTSHLARCSKAELPPCVTADTKV